MKKIKYRLSGKNIVAGRRIVSKPRLIIESMLRSKTPVIGTVILFIIVFSAIFAPLLVPNDPNEIHIMDRILPPAFAENGNSDYPLGTDTLGRCVLSRLIYGARVSLLVGFSAAVVAGIIGTILGMLAGYRGGLIDDVVSRFADIQLAFPYILLAISVLAVVQAQRGVNNLDIGFMAKLMPVILTLGISQWVTFARISRGMALSMREKEFVDAARALGDSTASIIMRNILPNSMAPIIVMISFNVGSSILAESSLSFLGLGVPPTVPTWGGMLSESRELLLTGNLWLSTLPGLCIVLTVLSINIIGDWLRDYLDPRMRGEI